MSNIEYVTYAAGCKTYLSWINNGHEIIKKEPENLNRKLILAVNELIG